MQKAVFIRKPSSLDEVLQHSYSADKADTYKIAEEWALHHKLYDHLTSHLLSDNPMFDKPKGGRKNGNRQVIKISSPDRETLLIDPSGYTYARYVARLN